MQVVFIYNCELSTTMQVEACRLDMKFSKRNLM